MKTLKYLALAIVMTCSSSHGERSKHPEIYVSFENTCGLLRHSLAGDPVVNESGVTWTCAPADLAKAGMLEEVEFPSVYSKDSGESASWRGITLRGHPSDQIDGIVFEDTNSSLTVAKKDGWVGYKDHLSKTDKLVDEGRKKQVKCTPSVPLLPTLEFDLFADHKGVATSNVICSQKYDHA